MSIDATLTKEPKLIHHDPSRIERSPYQPRQKFDPEEMRKLMESVREIGLIQPLVARAHPVKEGWLELIVGERRLRASIAAAVPQVLVLERVGLTERQVEQMVLEENIQRKNLTASEEGHAFERLLAMRDEAGRAVHTVTSIAEFIHEHVDYVSARLRLVACPKELIEAVDRKDVAVSVALLVGGIPDVKAREKCAREVLTPEIIDQQVPLTFTQTRELIREHFCVRLDRSKFDPEDPNLVPVKLDEAGERCQGGACGDCPFRSGNIGDSRNSVNAKTLGKRGNVDMLCTLPRCYRLKLDAQWRETKFKAEKAGKKTLDGLAAEKVFGGYNGHLTHDSGLLKLDESHQHVGGDYVSEPLKKALKGQAITVILARHPETQEIIELVERKDAEQALKAARRAAGDEPKSKEELQEEADGKERRAKELLKQKIDKLALQEGIAEIREAVATGRVKAGEDLLERLFECALDAAGSDGLKFIADTLEIERDKKAGGYGLDKPVQAWVKANVVTVPQWLSITAFVMLSRRVAWNGTDCEHFRAMLGLCGLKVADLERRAKALLAGEKKVKPEAKAGVKEEWSVEHETSKTAAADAIAKCPKSVRSLNQYCCDVCTASVNVPFGEGEKAAATPFGQMVCTMCGGTWKTEWQHMKENGISFEHMDFKLQVRGIVRGEVNYTDILGPRPAHNSEVWDKAKAKLQKAVERKPGEKMEDAKSPADPGDQVARILGGEGYPDVLGARPAAGSPARKKWEAAKVRLWKAVKKAKGAS